MKTIHKSFLSRLPSTPGVYRMLDEEGVVLYVGKASNLKKRVTSYFARQQAAKTQALVQQIATIETTITNSETEALLLESTLIKSLRPKYNILMRDDKSYPYLYVNSQHPFPAMIIMRGKKPKQGQFFGPYPGVAAVRETLAIIQKVFKIRNCSDIYFNTRVRPCLQHQIRRCNAPCVGYISEENYQRSLNDAIAFLKGKSQSLILGLEKRMDLATETLAFEEAAHLRDQIMQLRLVQERQNVVGFRGDVDVVAMEIYHGIIGIQFVTVREGRILTSENIFPSVPNLDDSELFDRIFESFISHVYLDDPKRIPPAIIINQSLQELPLFATTLSQLRTKLCQIQIKPRGIRAKWVEFALNNLRKVIAEREASISFMANRFIALQEFLQMLTPIERMECFDVSHTQGSATVAACVVFNANGPCKDQYRRYNITDITPGDDYAAIQQALTRRFKNHTILPDVLIIDGGKGQVKIAKQILEEYKFQKVIKLLGIAKGPTRKPGWEHLILADETQEIVLPSDSPALHLLQQIRDEAHRFAITFHRKKRQKQQFESILDHMPGVGPKRKQALLKRFGSTRELAKAPVEEIAKVSGISQTLAQLIYDYLHP